MSNFTLHKDDLVTIKQFVDKYPTVEFVTINVDSSSGIGSIVTASIFAIVNGDPVTITKAIMDESAW